MRSMHDAGGAVAEPEQTPHRTILGARVAAGAPAPPAGLPGLLDPERVRVELMRLRGPLPGRPPRRPR
jgi:hypothetical protein